MRILIVTTPVAPLGQGSTGGVTLQLENMVKALCTHDIDILALEGSINFAGATLISVHGTPQPSLAASPLEGAYPIPDNAVIGHLWQEAHDRQEQYDMIVNVAHDWLPYYVSPFFRTPVLHMVNMGDVNRATTTIISQTVTQAPSRVAFLSQTQARAFTAHPHPTIMPLGLDLRDYIYLDHTNGPLVWAGRISPEKGLEDSLTVTANMGEKLMIAGSIEDSDYWDTLQNRFADTIDYCGHLDRHALQNFLGKGRALLQTQKWEEAFGLVTIEALACGTPVIAYRRGANTELIDDGVHGYLIEPDDTHAMANAIRDITRIDRYICRGYIEGTYSLEKFAQNFEVWFERTLSPAKKEKAP